jgi:sugar phosphate permease
MGVHPYLIWGVAALFYMYQFVLRVAPSVLVEDLMVSFQASASSVGSLSAIAMYFYSFFQIPSGILSDHYGVRKVILSSLVLCILGTLVFASSNQLVVAQFGRLILGIGSSAAFLCLGKIASQYFPPNRRATLFGMAMSMGTIGALNGGAPLAYLVSQVGWRASLFVVGLLGGVIFFINFLVLEKVGPSNDLDRASNAQSILAEGGTVGLMDGIRDVFRNRVVWIHALSAMGVYLSLAVLADLWGPSFVVQRFKVDRQLAAQTLSWMYLGLFFGSLALSWLSDRLQNRKLLIVISTASISSLLVFLIYYPGLTLSQGTFMIGLLGFFAGAEMLCFTGASEAASVRTAGTVTGVVNTVVMLTGAVVQHQVGRLLDSVWTGEFLSEGVRAYSLGHFQYALMVLPILASGSFFASLFLPSASLSGWGRVSLEEKPA